MARSTKESEAAILEATCQERTSISASLNLLADHKIYDRWTV